MSLSPEIVERANKVLSGPLPALVVNPDVSPISVTDTCSMLLDGAIDVLHVMGSALEVQEDACCVDGKAVARLLWLHGNLLELYAALRGEPRS